MLVAVGDVRLGDELLASAAYAYETFNSFLHDLEDLSYPEREKETARERESERKPRIRKNSLEEKGGREISKTNPELRERSQAKSTKS